MRVNAKWNHTAEPWIFDSVQCNREIYHHHRINSLIMWTPIKINTNLVRNFIPFYFICHRPFGDNLMASLWNYRRGTGWAKRQVAGRRGNRRAVCGGNKITGRHIDPLSIVHLKCTNTLKAYKLFISNQPPHIANPTIALNIWLGPLSTHTDAFPFWPPSTQF